MARTDLKPLQIGFEGDATGTASEGTRKVMLRVSSAMRQNEFLCKQVASCVPAALMSQIVFIRVEQQILRVTVRSSTAASRLRFMTRELISAVRPVTGPIRKVTLHVLPAQALQFRRSQRKAPSSSKAANQVLQVARSIADNRRPVDSAPASTPTADNAYSDALAKALVRLAENLAK